ncbi:MAG TPA: AAA family ATPase [Pyrinomonadaceae bacterium]|jgi:predicted ATPase
MDGKRLIEKIRLRNILSFGDRSEEIELQPLNIIIGQNASGKSNLVDVIKLLRSVADDYALAKFISRNGGINEWIWKGKSLIRIPEIELYISTHTRNLGNIRYSIAFEEDYQKLHINNETIEFGNSKTAISRREISENLSDDDSIFSVIILENDNPNLRIAISTLKSLLLSPFCFTDLQTSRKSQIRYPQDILLGNDFLEEDGSNLSLVLNDLEVRGNTKDKIIENLRRFNPRIKDYSIKIIGEIVQLFIREEGLEKPVSAMRLSDGTLRYLCLLAILCHPEPPPLICIEEPETGLHPDILPTIAELMKDAAQRTQLIVTTHSDILVSAFSDMPEAILVCEKDEEGTHFRRLEADKLKAWLAEYELGDLWLKGEIGGKRW